MSSIKFISFSKIPTRLILNLYNEVYQDYYFSVYHNMVSFKNYFKKISGNLELSKLVVVDKSLVGLIIVATEDKKSWISAFGIKKEYRKQGLGELLLEHIINLLESEGVDQIGLEVLEYNYPAYNLYKKHGFNLASKLISLEGNLQKRVKTRGQLVDVSYENINSYLMDGKYQVWNRRKKRLKEDDIFWLGYSQKSKLLCFMGFIVGDEIIVKNLTLLSKDNGILNSFFSLLSNLAEFDKEIYLINFLESEWDIVEAVKEYGFNQFLKQNLLILNLKKYKRLRYEKA